MALPFAGVDKGIVARATLGPHGETPVEIGYRSRGLGAWTYAFGAAGVSRVRDFALEMTTDFRDIDFPPGTISPGSKTVEGRGWRLGWTFESLVTGQRIGIDPPNKLNPGPFAARITFFAPVSLLFFMTVIVMLGVLRGKSLHPVVGGMRFALAEAGVAHLVFLVLFGYAFFFEGYTGLTVTLGAIATLFVLMQMTGRVNWNYALSRASSVPGSTSNGPPA